MHSDTLRIIVMALPGQTLLTRSDVMKMLGWTAKKTDQCLATLEYARLIERVTLSEETIRQYREQHPEKAGQKHKPNGHQVVRVIYRTLWTDPSKTEG
jgi:hypothetical protein